uniref:Ion transport domain-containing protein n=1 Tax=Chromera velia CCMP2878 TaxID=1169474 RepID=A0A0G4FSN2_9ALVE|eukprot:Cvel_18419.t1-p1 / transcript=Cvel_18419.t1 / gene=Cvel_18419 / organism=Chromera_velia_CCMP2878 / gene_product=hypothetical protein / transcript_product=hypothetical protein / location=Cvel_scaffold1524:4662-7871(-) / protein_length=648 / sequence_SO=supercontig / SO=protein_coding / is_pseudo=false
MPWKFRQMKGAPAEARGRVGAHIQRKETDSLPLGQVEEGRLSGDGFMTSNMKKPLSARLREMFHSRYWELCMSAIVVANIVTVSISAEMHYKKPFDGRFDFMVFLPLYTAEICVRVAVEGRAYFRTCWNWSDIIFTGLMWVDLVVYILLKTCVSHMERSPIPILMIVPVFRGIRILRIFRLFKNNKTMRIFVEGLSKLLYSMVWNLLFLCFLLFAGAFVCQHIFADYVVTCDKDNTDCRDMDEMFANLTASMFTLFQVITLESWATQVARPADRAVPGMRTFFVLFIIITSYGMLNILVAGIVQANEEVSGAQEEMRRMELRKNREKRMIERLLTDNGRRWSVSKEEVLEVFEREIFQLLLERFGVSRRGMAKLPVAVEALFKSSSESETRETESDRLDALEVLDTIDAVLSEFTVTRREVDLVDLYMQVDVLCRSVSALRKEVRCSRGGTAPGGVDLALRPPCIPGRGIEGAGEGERDSLTGSLLRTGRQAFRPEHRDVEGGLLALSETGGRQATIDSDPGILLRQPTASSSLRKSVSGFEVHRRLPGLPMVGREEWKGEGEMGHEPEMNTRIEEDIVRELEREESQRREVSEGRSRTPQEGASVSLDAYAPADRGSLEEETWSAPEVQRRRDASVLEKSKNRSFHS